MERNNFLGVIVGIVGVVDGFDVVGSVGGDCLGGIFFFCFLFFVFCFLFFVFCFLFFVFCFLFFVFCFCFVWEGD